MEIRDYFTARELDVMAARYIQDEITEREFEREKRDRVFWIKQFGGEVPEHLTPETEVVITERTEDEAIEMSPLMRRR